ncbi:MAG TPA: hypothetical protein VMC03_10740 [Streptosporangiaceae bacterium]|nr:hypothetical protein [Streptosporangiaceae bacterium]
MSIQPPSADALGRRAGLFTPGPRLGWVFRDRRQLAAPFPEPAPDAAAMRAAAEQRAQADHASYRRFRKFLGLPSGLLLIVLLLADGCQANLNGTGPPVLQDLIALIICVPGIAVTTVKWNRSRQSAAQVARVRDDHGRALAAWQERDAAWQRGELSRVADADEWSSAVPPAGSERVDVFGGSLRGWQALLTTHGTSLLAAQPLLVLDLTGEMVCGELIGTAQAAGVPAVAWLLPAELGASGLLSGLSDTQFADAFAEAVHAGEPGGARAERAVDTRVLEQLHGALSGVVTLPRLAAAAGTALGHADRAGVLTASERELLAGELFAPEYRRQVEPNLVRIEAFLAGLARTADAGAAAPAGLRPAYLTCLAVEPGARSARAEVLAALAIQWLTVQVTGSDEPAPAVLIADADEISRPHLERLASACERRGVPLTLLFRHLRDSGLSLLGGGATAFMRLGNHVEADQAASYIGRQHRFVLSELTANLGGSQTHTVTETEGHTDTIHVGWGTGWRASGSRGEHRDRGRPGGRSVSRTWSTALSWAEGSNWGNAATSQRVHEYAVEPAVLQHLPDHAVLLVTRGPAGPVLQSVECDPAIVTLPRVSAAPLPDPAAALPGGTARSPSIASGSASVPAGWPAPAAPAGHVPLPPNPPRSPGER